MRIGADYYPEHWEKERWKTDAEMMVKANIKVIRIGEFAWSLYEPEEGKYEFDWMDEALDFFRKVRNQGSNVYTFSYPSQMDDR